MPCQVKGGGDRLKGIDPRLHANVLWALRAIGHGDFVVVVDTNFPADSIARHKVAGRLLRMENRAATQAVQAILTVLPQDTFVPDFAGQMEVVVEPATVPTVQAGVDRAEGKPLIVPGIAPFAFYDLANGAYEAI